MTIVRRACVIGMAVLLLAGCGTSGSGRSSSPAASSSGPPASSPTPAAPTTGASSSPATQSLSGSVTGKGLTCVVFVTSQGRSYALTGAVPHAVQQIAHARLGSGHLPESVTLEVTGHEQRDAMSTCGLPVFVATSVTVTSPTTIADASK